MFYYKFSAKVGFYAKYIENVFCTNKKRDAIACVSNNI